MTRSGNKCAPSLMSAFWYSYYYYYYLLVVSKRKVINDDNPVVPEPLQNWSYSRHETAHYRHFILISVQFVFFLLFLHQFFAPPPVAGDYLPELIKRRVLFGDPEVRRPLLAPDGSQLAYLSPSGKAMNIYVRSTKSNSKAICVSNDYNGIFRYFWQEDSRHLLYLQDTEGDENWHLNQINLKTGAIKNFTPFIGRRVDIIALSPELPDEILLAINLLDTKRMDAYRLSLSTGKIRLDTVNPGNVVEWHADHSLRIKAATAVLKDGRVALLSRKGQSSEWRPLIEWKSEEVFTKFLGFAPDNRSFFLLTSNDLNAAGIVEFDPDSGMRKIHVQDSMFDVYRAYFNPENYKLEAAQIITERQRWVCLNDEFKADMHELEKLGEGNIQVVSRTRKDDLWVVSYSSDIVPPVYFLYDRKNKNTRFLFESRPEIKRHLLAPMKPITFTARDGMKIYGYLILPPGRNPSGLPMIVRVHGGPWSRHTWGYNEEVQWLANRGYAVLEVNFRGSAGYGKHYLHAGNRQWGNKILKDLIDGRQWAVHKGYADPKRTGIFGTSFGGYAVLAMLAFFPDEFRCGAELSGPSDLIALIGSFPSYWNPLRPIIETRIGHPEKDKDLLRAYSPILAIDKIRSPLLIAHGANDQRVKKAESERVVQALKANSIPYQYIVFEDEGHYLSLETNRLKFYSGVEHFFSRLLGGRAEGTNR